jgi:hypothetical protein
MENIWPIIFSVIGVLITIGLKKGVSFLKEKYDLEGAKADALDAMYAGVVETYDWVKDRKAKNGGKLTEDDRAEARKMALVKAKEVATGPGLKVITETALPTIRSWIETFVTQAKKK